MRHRQKRTLELSTGVQKKNLVVRTMLTNLVTHGKMTTTPKRAKVLKAETDSFFSKLVRTYKRFEDEKSSKREVIRIIKSTILTEDAGKKIIADLLPRYLDGNTGSFVADYKMGARPGDASEKIMLKLL
ncbi:MAG: hypothetical protein CR971_02550 [candidate division SR1 bacterium]|nr:MAG: hypothetical protein CR971_02550 [candidate division SR1 bacterium]